MLNESNKYQLEKRKIANMIAQGESGNIHGIIHTPEIKDRIDEIDPRLFRLYDSILKSNDDILFNMFKVNSVSDGFKVLKNDLLQKYNDVLRDSRSGVNFSFENIYSAISIEQENREEILKIAIDTINLHYGNITKNINIIADFIDFDPSAVANSMISDVRKYNIKNILSDGYATSINGYNFVLFDYNNIDVENQKILYDQIKSGKQLDQLNSEVMQDYFKEGRFTIVAKSVMLPTLLHEIILGIYEVIISPSIPSDEDDVLSKTDNLKSEFTDYLYGRPFRNDIVNFIVDCADSVPNVDIVPNIKEYVFGEMMQLEDIEFLDFVDGIIKDKTSAKNKMVDIIRSIVSKFENWKNRKSTNKKKPNVVKIEDDVIDYSKMRQSELQKLLDDALDVEDYSTAEKISKYIK